MLLYRLEISFFLTASWAKERESPRLEMMKAARMAMMAMMTRSSIKVKARLFIT
jgi:hypothetical protein